MVADTAVAENIDPDALNSQFIPNQTAVAQIYAPLLTLGLKANPDNLGGGLIINPNKLYAQLVSSYKRNDVGNVLTFKLKRGIMSDYGNELTSDDVQWIYERSMAHARIARGNLRNTAQVIDFKVLDKYTFQFTTVGPNPISPVLLGFRLTLSPIDSTEAKKHATASDRWADEWLGQNGAGFGPYKITNWVRGQSITFQARPQWVGKKPYFTTVRVLAIPDLGARFDAVEAGDADVAFAITPDAAGRVNSKKDRGKLKINEFPGNGQIWFAPNYRVPQFADPLVRQAIAYAIPYDQIIKNAYKGHASIAKSLFYSYLPCGKNEYWHWNTNIQKAKQLMAQSNYPNGFGPVDFLYPAERPLMGLVATVLQASLQQIGIQTNLVPTPETVAQTRLNVQHDIPLYVSDTLAAVNPGVPGITQFFITGATTNIANYPRTQPFDQIHSEATTSLALSKQCDAANRFQKLFQDVLPFIPIAGFNDLYLMNSHIQGFSWYPDKSTRFATAYYK